MTDPKTLRELVFPLYELAVTAGAEIMRIYRNEDLAVEAKPDQSPLTGADKAAHRIIAEGLLEHTPEIPLLSEEGHHAAFSDRSSWDELWLVDPLDGTKEFIAGRNEFTVNIALVQHGVPVLGVVYSPALGEGFAGDAPPAAAGTTGPQPAPRPAATFYHAPAGCPLAPQPGASAPRGPVRVVASRSHLNQETADYIAVLEERLSAKGRSVERVTYGSSLKLCRLADGSAEIYPRFAPTMEWDTAAGHAVLRAAGGDCMAVEPRGMHEAGAPDDGPGTPRAALRYNKPDLHNPYFLAYSAQGRHLVVL